MRWFLKLYLGSSLVSLVIIESFAHSTVPNLLSLFTPTYVEAAEITISEFPIPTTNSEPYGIMAGPDGNIWFTEKLGNKIGRITAAGVITEYVVPTSNSQSAGITAGPDGNLWFTESHNNKIGRINLFCTALPATTPTLTNQAPIVNQMTDALIYEGIYSASCSFTDSDSASWTATVDYGDGTGVQNLPLNSDKTFNLSHIYRDEGVYTLAVSITDDQAATGTRTTTVTVNNANPIVGAISGSVNPIQVGTQTTASAPFTDAGILDTHTAVWDWGDGTTSTGSVIEANGSGNFSGDHVYQISGVYVITLTVSDNDGGLGRSSFQYLSVYNPTPQGLFAGARLFQSPQGAIPNNPSLTGQVQFGVTAKYQGFLPTGDANMNFNSANLEFDATSITLFIVSGNKSILRGTGTVNGLGNYNFLAVGLDGGQGADDYIRFQIKDQSGTTVYDTQPGAADTADPTTIVSAGQLIVH